MRKLKLPIVPWPLQTVETFLCNRSSASGIRLCVQSRAHCLAPAVPSHFTVRHGTAAGGSPRTRPGLVVLGGLSLGGSRGGHVGSGGLLWGVQAECTIASSVDSAGPHSSPPTLMVKHVIKPCCFDLSWRLCQPRSRAWVRPSCWAFVQVLTASCKGSSLTG